MGPPWPHAPLRTACNALAFHLPTPSDAGTNFIVVMPRDVREKDRSQPCTSMTVPPPLAFSDFG